MQNRKSLPISWAEFDWLRSGPLNGRVSLHSSVYRKLTHLGGGLAYRAGWVGGGRLIIHARQRSDARLIRRWLQRDRDSTAVPLPSACNSTASHHSTTYGAIDIRLLFFVPKASPIPRARKKIS